MHQIQGPPPPPLSTHEPSICVFALMFQKGPSRCLFVHMYRRYLLSPLRRQSMCACPCGMDGGRVVLVPITNRWMVTKAYLMRGCPAPINSMAERERGGGGRFEKLFFLHGSEYVKKSRIYLYNYSAIPAHKITTLRNFGKHDSFAKNKRSILS